MKKTYTAIKQYKASDLIVEELWSAILNGELNPGDKLPPERELVEQFEVSKVTLREALQKLEAYDLIERKRGASGGAIVQEMAPTKGFELISDYLNLKGYTFEDLIKAKLFIEPQIAQEAAVNITDEGVEELRILISKHEAEFLKKGRSKFGRQLEPLLAKLAGNRIFQIIDEFLQYLVKDVEDNLDLENPEVKTIMTEYHKETFEDHKLISSAIISKDPEAARTLMFQHRLRWSEYIRKLDKYHIK